MDVNVRRAVTIRRAAGPLGLGAAVCAACCAGPLLGVLGGLGLAGSGIAVAAGATTVAVLFAAAAVGLLVAHRSRRQAAPRCPPPAATDQAVAVPRRRSEHATVDHERLAPDPVGTRELSHAGRGPRWRDRAPT